MSFYVAQSTIAFRYNLSLSIVPGLISTEKESSTYVVMFRDLLRVLEKIDVLDNCIVISETEILDVVILKFR